MKKNGDGKNVESKIKEVKIIYLNKYFVISENQLRRNY